MAKKKKEENKDENIRLEFVENLRKSIKILDKPQIDAKEMEFLATAAYQFFLITHWNMIASIETAEDKEIFIRELINTVYNNLIELE